MARQNSDIADITALAVTRSPYLLFSFYGQQQATEKALQHELYLPTQGTLLEHLIFGMARRTTRFIDNGHSFGPSPNAVVRLLQNCPRLEQFKVAYTDANNLELEPIVDLDF
jgi:hypothetical protein